MRANHVVKTLHGHPTVDGAGVHLRRVFGFQEIPALDPFLLLDDFRSDRPEHYLPGFPWHPHRGIETITYLFEGSVEHGDSLGNRGVIGPGDVQWMTAGNGVIHQEMPKGDERGRMGGLQLWTNLPARYKRMAPRYQGFGAADIPLARLQGGGHVRVVSGLFEGVQGAVREVVAHPVYLDVELPPGAKFRFPTDSGHTILAYVVDGKGDFGEGTRGHGLVDGTLAVLGEGDYFTAVASEKGVRFIFLSGKPLKESVAWGGPIVMNTQEELREAFEQLEKGTFLDPPREG